MAQANTVVLQLELSGCPAAQAGSIAFDLRTTTLTTQAMFRAGTQVAQALAIIRARYYGRLRPEEALIAFVREEGKQMETVPKMTDLVDGIPPATLLVMRENVFG